MSEGARGAAAYGVGAAERFHVAVPSGAAQSASELWRAVEDAPSKGGPAAAPGTATSRMEAECMALATLREAPPRTSHSRPVVRSSPMPSALRAMLERREFGRRYDATPAHLAGVRDLLPPLDCPPGDLQFLADERSFQALSRSVDCLLQHRKQLLAASEERTLPRRDVLVLGAGPAGLMAAVELRLRDHRVVVCEQREAYTRNRFIGVYKEVAHALAALGMPERMTYDFTHYRGKRGIMLADMQTFLHGVALKLGVILYTGATARDLTAESLRAGELALHRAALGERHGDGDLGIGVTRWHYDTVQRVRSGVRIRFDTIVEATGGRCGLRELLVGEERVVSIRTVARDAAHRDPSLDAYFDDPEDHCARFVESDYGCPPEVRREFAAALLGDDHTAIPDEVPCFVSNVDASIILQPIEPPEPGRAAGARMGTRELAIPRDWVIVQCPRTDGTLTRYQIEGPLPQAFEFGGARLPTRDTLEGLNPVSLLLRLLYAMGVPFEAVDRRRLVDFYTVESSRGDASDVVATWLGRFRGLGLGGPDPLWCGRLAGSGAVEYGIIGEALQNAWYRFGVGVDDTFAGAQQLARCLDLGPEARRAEALRFERRMTSRSVQVLYHLYRVTQNAGQGVVGPVLTEVHMDRRYGADLAEAGIRQEARQAGELRAALVEVCREGDGLLAAALEHRIDVCCRRALELLGSLDADPAALRQATQIARAGDAGWRPRALRVLTPVLPAPHLQLLSQLFGGDAPPPSPSANPPSREERLLEIAMGRYAWATPWVRACALSALDPGTPGAAEALARAAAEPDPCVADAAAEALAAAQGPLPGAAPGPARYTLPAKVAILQGVSLFAAIPHEELAAVAALLADRRAEAGERVFAKGDLGDSLYVIASGRVRVHDGERALRVLGPNESFGELSLLDTEPRSASVTAEVPTHLLRIDQADFYALLAERPEVLRATNRALCRMLRRAPAA